MSVARNGSVICDDCGRFIRADDVGFRYGFTVGAEPPEENYHLHGCPSNKDDEEGTKMAPVHGWHFARADNRLRNGDIRKIVLGETLHVDGEITPCEVGLHASVRAYDALHYAQGPMLWRVELSGTIVPHANDKHAASDRKAIAGGKDASGLLRLFARQCALDVLHLWDAPQVVRDYLQSGDDTLRDAAQNAARSAEGTARSALSALSAACAFGAARSAWNATWNTALSAAQSATKNAAWGAADAAQRAQVERFERWCEQFVANGTLPEPEW